MLLFSIGATSLLSTSLFQHSSFYDLITMKAKCKNGCLIFPDASKAKAAVDDESIGGQDAACSEKASSTSVKSERVDVRFCLNCLAILHFR